MWRLPGLRCAGIAPRACVSSCACAHALLLACLRWQPWHACLLFTKSIVQPPAHVSVTMRHLPAQRCPASPPRPSPSSARWCVLRGPPPRGRLRWRTRPSPGRRLGQAAASPPPLGAFRVGHFLWHMEKCSDFLGVACSRLPLGVHLHCDVHSFRRVPREFGENESNFGGTLQQPRTFLVRYTAGRQGSYSGVSLRPTNGRPQPHVWGGVAQRRGDYYQKCAFKYK